MENKKVFVISHEAQDLATVEKSITAFADNYVARNYDKVMKGKFLLVTLDFIEN